MDSALSYKKNSPLLVSGFANPKLSHFIIVDNILSLVISFHCQTPNNTCGHTMLNFSPDQLHVNSLKCMFE